jgi:hypothetical protein
MTRKPSVARVIGFCGAMILLAGHGPTEGLAARQKPVLNAADLAFLWPPPGDAADVTALIAGDLTLADGTTRLWPQAVFDALMKAVDVPAFESGRPQPFRIKFGDFKAAFEKPATWKLTGFRFDPSAPGGHKDVVGRFGSTPQLRFVFQPVTTDGDVRVHDVTAHLAFSFTVAAAGGKPGPAQPDRAAVKAILDELRDLKRAAAAGGAGTDGPLGIHPGLAANPGGFRDKVRTFLPRAAARGQLTELAFMGIERPEPWIFFLMRRGADGKFTIVNATALGKKNAQMLSFRTSTPEVVPEPVPANVPPHGGVSTARLFAGDASARLDDRVFPGQARPLVRDIPDIIANPERSNVINTDCMSCHTESTRRLLLKADSSDGMFRYRLPAGISAVDPAVLPASAWNVRNFGWFERGGVIRPTISQRTANEAAEAADFANREYFATSSSNGSAAAVAATTGAGAAIAAAPGPRTRSVMTEQRKPVANPLTLVMRLKSPQDFKELKAQLEKLQSLPPEKNPIMVALTELGTVHFARFVFLGETHLAVITTYDGSFEDYIDSFVEAIGDIFDVILSHVADAPPLPVRKPENRKAFLEYVRKNDLTAMPPFFSAYPDLTVTDILKLQKKQ